MASLGMQNSHLKKKGTIKIESKAAQSAELKVLDSRHWAAQKLALA
jgi:hypothetical protein